MIQIEIKTNGVLEGVTSLISKGYRTSDGEDLYDLEHWSRYSQLAGRTALVQGEVQHISKEGFEKLVLLAMQEVQKKLEELKES